MKRILPFIFSALLLTACGSDGSSLESRKADNISETAAESESTSEAEDDVIYIERYESSGNECLNSDDYKMFDSISDFEEYASSGQLNEEYPEVLQIQARSTGVENDRFIPLVPQYDENKYKEHGVKFRNTGYIYFFEEPETGRNYTMHISFGTYYHTFEEMVESKNANLVFDVENSEAVVWGDTPVLIQTVPLTNPVEYTVHAMIGESNSVYMCMAGMTPQEMIDCLNDFTFT
ncbi:MAG: hypothetical protein ACI4I9_08925 [Porcipelethomonas sp.]